MPQGQQPAETGKTLTSKRGAVSSPQATFHHRAVTWDKVYPDDRGEYRLPAHAGHKLSYGVVNNVAETDIFCHSCRTFLTGAEAIALAQEASPR